MKHYIPVCAVFFLVAFLVGCGPTRKEYAINEALLIDQTRMLEDQLYRAHFQIQTLQDENSILRERLGEKPKKEKEQEPPVKFDGGVNLPRPEQQAGYADPGQSAYPADDLSFGASQPAAPMPAAGPAPYPAQYTQQAVPYRQPAPSRYRLARQPVRPR
ncbi:MAG: hypothetical protein IJG60_00185 [Thermoguttaceae bacterium]|nr:hypothetical protein [Thermoguttaceae bacterium]